MDVTYRSGQMDYDGGGLRGELGESYKSMDHAMQEFLHGSNLQYAGRVGQAPDVEARGQRKASHWAKEFDRIAATIVEASSALGEPLDEYGENPLHWKIVKAAERHYERQSERARALLGRIAEVVGEHADNVIRQRADGVVADYAAQDRVTKDLLRWASDAAATHVENGRWGRDPDRTPLEVESAVLDTYQAYIYKRPAPTSRATVHDRHHHLERTGSFEYQR